MVKLPHDSECRGGGKGNLNRNTLCAGRLLLGMGRRILVGRVEEILRTFTERDFEVLDHVAGVRPIIQRSRPVVKFEEGRGWMVNGLGSKGVIYAPRVGAEMVDVTAN